MKPLVYLLLMSVSVFAGALDDGNATGALANMSGKAGDAARQILMYPALPGELPGETEARRALLVLLDNLKKAGTLTPELELQIKAQIAQILVAEAARQQSALDAAKPVHVIIDN